MNQLGVDYLPSKPDLKRIGMVWLSNKIERNGGFSKIANELKIPNKGRRTNSFSWTTDRAEKEIIQIKDSLGLDRMPTRSEILNFRENNDLCSYISRSYGFYGYASRLGLPIKESETTVGKKFEYIVSGIIHADGHSVEHMPQNHPYDLFVDGCLKIDVKYSNLFQGEHGNFYRFSWEKKYPACDVYVLISSKTGEQDCAVIRVIPSCHIDNTSGLAIGEHNSIYDMYINRWDYIDEYLSFYKRMKESRCSA